MATTIGHYAWMQASRPSSRGRSFDPRRITRGTLIGFAGVVVVQALILVERHFIRGSGGNNIETALSLLDLVCYWSAGYFAVQVEDDCPATAGALAGLGVAVLGLATSVVEWVVQGGGAFLRGAQAAHPGIALLGPFVFSGIVAAVAGVWASNHRATLD
jgi:hypothetical protein